MIKRYFLYTSPTICQKLHVAEVYFRHENLPISFLTDS